MENINKIENMIEGWLRPLPHIPAKATKMIAENLWWIVGIGIIISGIGVLVSINGIYTAAVFLGRAAAYFGYYANSFYTGWWVAAAAISLLALIANVALMVMAFSHLKVMHKKGWDLLFYSLLIMVAARIVIVVLNFSVYSLFVDMIVALLGIAVGMYLLFEIKSYFKSSPIATVQENK
jgi:hypothetical protein